jgi:hypothetical protein
MQFEIANFEMAYNTFLRKPTLTKFMAIPHYAYLVLKMLDPNVVISSKGDVKQAYDYDTTGALLASIELQKLKRAMDESPADPVMSE